MNEPIGFAQQRTGVVTTLALLQHVKGASSVYIHGEMAYGRASYSDAFIFTVSAKRRAKGVKRGKDQGPAESITTLEVPGYVSNGECGSVKVTQSPDGFTHAEFQEHYRPERGFWSLFGAAERLMDVLRILPRDAEVGFFVYLDAGTNGYARQATYTGRETYTGLHVDHLYLCAAWTRGGKRQEAARFLIDTTLTAHNTARFGVGR